MQVLNAHVITTANGSYSSVSSRVRQTYTAHRAQPCQRRARPARPSRPRTVAVRISDSAEVPSTSTVSERLTGDRLQQWQDSLSVVTDLGLEYPEAERLLAKAFGWGSARYWKQTKAEEMPDAQEVEAVVEYLRGLGVTDAELLRMMKVFPELLACSLDTLVKENVGRLQKEWKLQGPTLARTLARQPQVLGYAYDCEGTCFGECERCWARF